MTAPAPRDDRSRQQRHYRHPAISHGNRRDGPPASCTSAILPIAAR
jgi:hypothetical protein